ncbi:MAG: response regulator [Deltaproteobacteria bacterium]|jgi:putative two-component system response regulator|nr:response regulator [Deltaproteobacteria bacterium]
MSDDSWETSLMVVDDSLTNLKCAKTALSSLGNVYTVPSAEKMFALLKTVKPSLILLDVNMPGMNGLEAIKLLKADLDLKDVPVIFLTSNAGSLAEIEGLSLGAVDYITKPFEEVILKKRVEIQLTLLSQREALKKKSQELVDFNANLQKMVAKEMEKVMMLQGTVMETVVDLVEGRDDITGGHISRTRRWLSIMLNGLVDSGLYAEEVNTWDTELFLQSSRLHDLGKIGISDSILKKPGALDNAEFEAMKKHTTIGAEIIDKICQNLPPDNYHFLNHAKTLAISHHEKWNGKGYPFGLAGLNIPLQGRLMAITDVYDALISKRPYKAALTHEQAVEIIISEAGGHFDPELVNVFKRICDDFIK